MCRRFAFPVRLLDLVPQFGRPVPTICLIAQHMVQHLDGRFVNLLTSLERPWLSRENLQNMAAAVTSKNAGFENCWDFVDGTGREIYRPGEDQRIYYNGHKRKHKKDRELKEREIIALESKSKSPDTTTADLLLKQQQQFLDSMSQQHKEMHTLMILQHENFMSALTQSQQQITALVESQRQMHELLKLTLGMQQRP